MSQAPSLHFVRQLLITFVHLNEEFSWNPVNISDCQAFSLIETVISSLILTNVKCQKTEQFYGVHKLDQIL